MFSQTNSILISRLLLAIFAGLMVFMLKARDEAHLDQSKKKQNLTLISEKPVWAPQNGFWQKTENESEKDVEEPSEVFSNLTLSQTPLVLGLNVLSIRDLFSLKSSFKKRTSGLSPPV